MLVAMFLMIEICIRTRRINSTTLTKQTFFNGKQLPGTLWFYPPVHFDSQYTSCTQLFLRDDRGDGKKIIPVISPDKNKGDDDDEEDDESDEDENDRRHSPLLTFSDNLLGMLCN